MDRKQFLATWRTAKQQHASFANNADAAFAPTASLQPYTGAWTRKQVAHLLRRATFGVKKSDVTALLALSPGAAVDQLLNAGSMPANPVNDFENASQGITDGVVPFGADWTNSATDGDIWQRHLSFDVWTYRLALNQPRSLREKMWLFWYNHFGTSKSNGDGLVDSRRYFKHFNMLRANALGNVKNLVNLVTKDALMLDHLSGSSNTFTSPNENYAREVQELFVVGKYPTQLFSEEDVRQAARLLTGWKYNQPHTGYFSAADHDTGNKTFSAFYNNRTITGRSGATGGQAELNDFLDMIFTPVDSALFICRKLYRFFVQYKISADVEATIIPALANTFRTNNFEIKPVLSQLLKSEHFFDLGYNGSGIIKSPMDLYAGLMKTFRTQDSSPAGIGQIFEQLNMMWWVLYNAQMQLAQCPNVAGYPAYTTPLYDKYWISTVTLPKRSEFLTWMMYKQDYPFFDFMKLTNSFDTPANPNLLIAEALDLLYALPVGSDVTTHLKSILLSGQATDSYWTQAWLAYKANPTNPDAYGVVYTRLQTMYLYLLQLEEVQLM
jgi:uncharacterized protein (DUF1800 family)